MQRQNDSAETEHRNAKRSAEERNLKTGSVCFVENCDKDGRIAVPALGLMLKIAIINHVTGCRQSLGFWDVLLRKSSHLFCGMMHI